jgi:hypothetical protein
MAHRSVCALVPYLSIAQFLAVFAGDGDDVEDVDDPALGCHIGAGQPTRIRNLKRLGTVSLLEKPYDTMFYEAFSRVHVCTRQQVCYQPAFQARAQPIRESA